jgi:hypothetical protein
MARIVKPSKKLLGNSPPYSPSARAYTQSSTPKHPQSIWRSPMLWLGGISTLLLLFIPLWWDWQTLKVISFYLTDVSSSGINDPKTSEIICQARWANLKPGDLAIDIEFANRDEPTRYQKINVNTDLVEQCQGNQRPPTIGKEDGTNPIAPITRLLNATAAERAKGNKQPITVVIWLQDAEPVPGSPIYDWDDFQEKVEQVTKNRAKIVFLGPTGQLRELLDKRLSTNPDVYLCPISATAECIKQVFDSARTPIK